MLSAPSPAGPAPVFPRTNEDTGNRSCFTCAARFKDHKSLSFGESSRPQQCSAVPSLPSHAAPPRNTTATRVHGSAEPAQQCCGEICRAAELISRTVASISLKGCSADYVIWRTSKLYCPPPYPTGHGHVGRVVTRVGPLRGHVTDTSRIIHL